MGSFLAMGGQVVANSRGPIWNDLDFCAASDDRCASTAGNPAHKC
jgi:hypothetical protein